MTTQSATQSARPTNGPRPTNVHCALGLRASANELEFAYDTFSTEQPAAGEPLFLIMGIGAQRIYWPDGLCNELAQRGFLVVRFDNRDVGESSRLDNLPTPGVLQTMTAIATGTPLSAPYTLDHMADDTAHLIEALGFDSAHICGASMGGMIAQTLAYRWPDKVRSLTSIMSTTGNPSLPPANPSISSVLVEPAPHARDAYADHAVKVWRVIGSPDFEFDENGVRERARLAFDRGISPKGFSRQLAAIVAHGNRKPKLTQIAVPTTVIHGDADKLVPPAGGVDTAEAIPNSELLMIKGMGHDFPAAVWRQIADAVRATADRVSSSA